MQRLCKCSSALVLALIVTVFAPHPGYAADSMSPSQAGDYTAIQSLIVKYAHVYDARDIEGYVSVFAEDAQFTFGNTTLNGRQEIRNFITRVANTPVPEPVIKSFHSISNTLIEFISANEAHHRSYWQVLSGPATGPFTVNSMGFYDDVIVKENGQWLIKKRNIPN